MSGSPKAHTPSRPTARTSCAASPAATPRSWYAASSPPATTGHAPPTRSPQAPTARISPDRVPSLSARRVHAGSIQADGLPALARGNPGTGGRAAARDRPTHPGVLSTEPLAGALVAAEQAQMPLLDLLEEDLQAPVADPDSDSWAELDTLSRAEVSQATGMLAAQLEVEPAEALVRLRAARLSTGRSTTDIACDILDRRHYACRPTDARSPHARQRFRCLPDGDRRRWRRS